MVVELLLRRPQFAGRDDLSTITEYFAQAQQPPPTLWIVHERGLRMYTCGKMPTHFTEGCLGDDNKMLTKPKILAVEQPRCTIVP